MNLVESILKLFGARIFTSIMGFIGLAYFAQTLGANELGVFFLFQGVVSILMLPANFGLRAALEKRMSGSESGSSYLSTTIVLKSIPITIVAACVLLFRTELNSYVGASIAVLIVISLIVEEAHQMIIHLLRGEMRVSRSADILLLRQLVWVIGGAVTIEIFKYGAKGLIYTWILSAAVSFVIGLYIRSTPLGQPSRSNARSLFDYAKFDVVSGAGSTLFSWLDVVVIGFVLTQMEVGAYETAWRLSAAAVMFGLAIRNAIFPQISAWDSRGDQKKISNTLTDMITASLFFVIPSFVGIALLSEELLGIIFGQEFVIAAAALSVLIGQKLFQALNQTVGRTLQAINHPDLAAYAMVVGILSNLILNFALVTRYGLVGAAIATITSYGLMTCLRTHFLRKHLPVKFEWRDIGWCVTGATVMGVAVWLLKSRIAINTLPVLMMVVLFGAAVYFVTVLISPSLREKILYQASKLFNRDVTVSN
jgi:O-antigen/teichoic acid export membrane protein